MNKLLLISILALILCMPFAIAGATKIPIYNPFGRHLQYLATGFDGNITKDIIWNADGVSAVLNTTINATATSIILNGNLTSLDFPSSGVLVAGTELIPYASFAVSNSTSTITASSRGKYASTAAGHTAGITVYFSRFLIGFNESIAPLIEIDTNREINIFDDLRIWDDARGADDYISIWHTATSGYIHSVTGSLYLNSADAIIAQDNVIPVSSNTKDLGSGTYEWRGLYIGEDALSGAYFGLDQNFRLFYNETSADELQLTDGSNIFMRFNDINNIGSGDDSQSLSSSNDLFVTGKFEVDGISYLDASVIFGADGSFADNGRLRFGGSPDADLDWSTAQATEHALVWGLGDDSESLIFTVQDNANKDFDHPAQSNPTIFIHSDTDPDTNNTQWTSLTHDQTSTVLDSGTDSIVLDDTTYISGNLELSDENVGTEIFNIYHDGTDVIIDAVADDSIKMITTELQIWDDAEGTNDYVSISHSGTAGTIHSTSGSLFLNSGSSIYSYDSIIPTVANSITLGSATFEWRQLLLGEDASSGIYYGLDQNFRVWYNETSADVLTLSAGATEVYTINTTGYIDIKTDLQAENFYSGDGSQGLTGTATVRDSGGAGDCTLTYKDGLLTATTCTWA